MSNSRSWQGLYVLHREMIESTTTGKDIGHFQSSTKDFLPSGPKKRGGRKQHFCAWKRWLVTREESCPGCLGRQDVKLGRPSVYFEKASSKFLICAWTCITSLSPSSPFLLGAFPASIPGRKRTCGPTLLVALSPLGHSVTLSPVGSEAPGRGG